MGTYQTYEDWKTGTPYNPTENTKWDNLIHAVYPENATRQDYNNAVFYEGYKTGDPTRDAMLVAPSGDPNTQYTNLLRARSDYINASSAPYEQELFAGMTYGNPDLQQNYINQAIPQVQQNIQDAQQVTGNVMKASGLAFDPTEQKINARLATLRSEENIAGAANTIRQRLRERDMNTALGAGSTASYSMLSNQS